MTLQLAATTKPVTALHWHAAAFVQANLQVMKGASMIAATSGATTVLAPALAQALQSAASNVVVFAEDPQGDPWRLRRVANSDCFEVQSLAASRRGCLQQLRSILAAQLSGSLLHELRNPLNALGLQCDLLGRALASPLALDSQTQLVARVAQMRERLRHLLENQNALVASWLAELDPSITAEPSAVIEDALRLLRSYGSQREVQLRGEQLEALAAIGPLPDALRLRLVITALAVLAVDSSVRLQPAQQEQVIVLRGAKAAAAQRGVRALLLIEGPLHFEALSPHWNCRSLTEFLASLALLLDGTPVALTYPADAPENPRPVLAFN